MAKIHLVLQGKGGVGKSLIANLLAQYWIAKGQACVGIDTDPVNASFSQFASLPIQRIDLLQDGDIDSSKFDGLMNHLMDQDKNTEVVVDNGAASFIPLCDYLLKHQAIELLQAEGHRVLVHTIVTGGQSFLDTLSGFDSIASQFPSDAAIVLWINPYFGDVHQEKPFNELHVIQKHQQSLFGTINLPKQSGLFADDFRSLLESHRTFDEVKEDAALWFMNRRRLSMIQSAFFSAMEPVLGKLDD